MDPDMITGAVIALVGYGWGYLFGYRRKRPPKPIQEICQCDHPSSTHDKDGCHASIRTESKWDNNGWPRAWEYRPCACIRYVGPLSSYVPELEGEPRERTTES